MQQPLYYRVPGERRDCPACGSRRIRHVRPLAYSQLIDHRWRVGFISGCAACGLLFANPFPTDEHLADVYSPEGDWGRSRQQDEKSLFSGSPTGDRALEPVEVPRKVGCRRRGATCVALSTKGKESRSYTG